MLCGNPHRCFAVNFWCTPFWYLTDVELIPLISSTSIISNPGSVYPESIISVYGSGEITIMVGTTIVELSDVSGSITIDALLMEAYSGNVSMNACMSGDFPRLQPGQNAISWSESVTRVEILPNWRFL